MPGIFGIVRKNPDTSRDKSPNQALGRQMTQRLLHLDHYGQDLYCDADFALGKVELTLPDESRFLVDRDRRAVGAFSGYIYGWQNLPAHLTSNTTAKAHRLIDVYFHELLDPVAAIDGSYCAAVLDLDRRRMRIWNDRLGHRAIYYYQDDEIFMFATEMKAFKAYEKFDPEIDIEAVADYFNYGYPLGEKTFFKRIKRLPGGHAITVVDGRIEIARSGPDFEFTESEQPVAELIEELDEIYPPILLKRIAGARQVILPLSGGLDSRFILGHALRAGVEPHVFVHGKKNCLDHRITRRMARESGLQHYKFVDIDPNWLADYSQRFVFLTEGMIYNRPAALLGISAQYGLPPTSSCFLNGIFGGPTNFGKGYFTHQDLQDDLTRKQKLQSLRRRLLGAGKDSFFYSLFAGNHGQYFQDRYLASLDEDFARHEGISERFCHQKDTFFIRNRLARAMNQIDIHRYIWHDHFALADDRLLDFYLKLPAAHKLSRQFLMEYFKIKMPDLARFPYQATGYDLYSRPPFWKRTIRRHAPRFRYLVERASHGMVPMYNMREYYHYDQWYRTHPKIRGFFEDVLLDQSTIARGYFDRKRIQQLLAYQRKGGSTFLILSNLISFELFHRLFVDQ